MAKKTRSKNDEMWPSKLTDAESNSLFKETILLLATASRNFDDIYRKRLMNEIAPLPRTHIHQAIDVNNAMLRFALNVLEDVNAKGSEDDYQEIHRLIKRGYYRQGADV